jgi:hypothetical protein
MSEEDPIISSYIEIDSLFSGGASVMITIEATTRFAWTMRRGFCRGYPGK